MIEEWAPPESLLGLLQRGRGLGYQQAQDAPGARELVLACIADDARWWRQVDQRARFYARLVVDLGIPVAAIRVDTQDPELPSGLAYPVLVELSAQGSAQAAAVLHEHLARTADPDWSYLVDDLWADGGPAARDGLAELVLGRLDDAGLAAAVRPDPDGPWQAWAPRPRVAEALRGVAPYPTGGLPDLNGSRTGELLVLARDPQASALRSAAFGELSRRGNTTLLELAERPDLRNSHGFVASLDHHIRNLGPLALARARDWIDGDDDWLRALGRDVVSDHGGSSDAGRILAWFESAVQDGDWCASEDFADGLARLGHRPALPCLASAWVVTEHSFARSYYLRALISLEAPGLGRYLEEAVDDCEADVRELAVGGA